MRFKGTLVLLVVVAAFGGYLYWYEYKGAEQRTKAKSEENRLWKVESAAIEQIDLTSQGAAPISAQRSGEKEWKITSPRPLEADAEELNRIASSAAEVNRESVIEPNATDLARFGLEPPQTKLEFRTKDGTRRGIRFGINNPTGNSTYAALEGKNQVFLVGGYVASSFNKKLDDLRNRAILAFDQFEARSLDVKSDKGTVQLVKDNDRWFLQGKDRWAADSASVSGMLGALANTKLKEFLDDPDEYPTLGFDKPTADVTVTVTKDKAIKHLVIGLPKSKLLKKGEKPKPEPKKAEAKKPEAKKDDAAKKDEAKKEETPATAELYVARDDSRKELFFVEKEFVDKLLKAPADLRDKALATFQRWDIDDITLRTARGEFHFTKPGGTGDWVLGDAKKKTKWEAVSGILDALEKPVKSFVDEPAAASAYGLDNPRARVVLKQGGAVKLECAFGRDAPDGVYAQVRGETSVKVADKDSFAKLDKTEVDFVEPPAPAAPASPHPTEPKK